MIYTLKYKLMYSSDKHSSTEATFTNQKGNPIEITAFSGF